MFLPAIFLPRSLKDWQEDDWQKDDSEKSLRDAATRWNDTITPKTLGFGRYAARPERRMSSRSRSSWACPAFV